MPTPEIVAPAGDLQKLNVALHYGADAVYCGIPATSMRARQNIFELEDLITARRLTRERGVKMYLTCNIYPRGAQVRFFEQFIRETIPRIDPDAVIFADPGVFHLLRKHLPGMKLHLSVQANTVNPAAARFWYEQGVSRIIVARELSLKEMAAIHAEVPELELEAFVHGSICFTYSGRCLISNWLTRRDSNRGTCANSCRWKWTTVREAERPGEDFELEEDEHGSYLFNSKDMCLIEHIRELMDAGVLSFKIEGRHKTVGYLGTVVHAYRQAVDDAAAGRPFDTSLLREVYAVGNRGYTKGFFDGTQQDLQNYDRGDNENPQTFLGMVEENTEQRIENKESFNGGIHAADVGEVSLAKLFVKNRFAVGDAVEVVTRDGVFATTIAGITDEKGNALNTVHGGRETPVFVDLGRAVGQYALIRRAVAAGDDAHAEEAASACAGCEHAAA